MNKYSEILDYIRVGTTYYKKIEKPLISKDSISMLIPWNIETLRSDFDKTAISNIEKYTGFCCIPSHLNYQKIVSNQKDENVKILGFYNEYQELVYTPKKGDCFISLKFVKHIFGEQFEYGLDFLKILYEKPTQILPVLCLVSKDNNTGKTLFLNWLKKIFSKNMTLNTNDDFRSQFNSDWANKLIIAVDEVLLDRKDDSERIKNLSTARKFKSEAKGKDKIEIEFFGKFILCSNNENNFIYLEVDETRFWVRKIPSFSDELLEVKNNIFSILVSEIPAFLDYLVNRDYSTPQQSRMWFTPEQLSTKALHKLKFSNRSKLELEIVSLLITIMDIEAIDELCYTPTDIRQMLSNNDLKTSLSNTRRLLKDKWNLKAQINSNSYIKYTLNYDGSVSRDNQKGRYYTFTKTFISDNFDDFDDI